jgi:hypothetical protein
MYSFTPVGFQTSNFMYKVPVLPSISSKALVHLLDTWD